MKPSEQITEMIEKLQRVRLVAEQLESIGTTLDVTFNIYEQQLIVYVRSMDELHEARTALRSLLGTWTDSLKTIWASYGTAYAWWCSATCPEVGIRLRTPIADFPKELMGPTCSFEETTRTETYYVCKPV